VALFPDDLIELIGLEALEARSVFGQRELLLFA
jgi:hypothetical protein